MSIYLFYVYKSRAIIFPWFLPFYSIDVFAYKKGFLCIIHVTIFTVFILQVKRFLWYTYICILIITFKYKLFNF